MIRSVVFVLISLSLLNATLSYSAVEDEKYIRQYLDNRSLKAKPQPPKDHAKVARNLVHKAKWASVGTISTDDVIEGFPMVNIISIADGKENDKSTGIIYFLSTTLDFTGKDLLAHNKTTFMISDDEDLHCSKQQMDPMEPTCARAHFTGSVVKMDKSFPDYDIGYNSMVQNHPAAENWMKAHVFSLCKVNINNIYVLDFYGGPHRVEAEQYYASGPDSEDQVNDMYELSEQSANELRKSLDYYSSSATNEVNIKLSRNKYRKINIQL